MLGTPDFIGLANAYEKWKKTPEGQKRLKEVDARKVVEIIPLPLGWELDEIECSEESKSYYCPNQEIKVRVEMVMDNPIQFGGRQTINVAKVEEPDEDEEEPHEWVMFHESVETPNWKEVAQRANAKALEFMQKVKS